MDKDKAQELASLLRQVADLLETKPENFEPAKKAKKKKGRGTRSRLDPFNVLLEEGETGLLSRLNRMSSVDLKRLIRNNRLDSTGLTNKWHDKEHLVQFTFDRLIARQRHGQVFMKPDQQSEQLSQ